MPALEYFLVAEGLSIDQATNSVSLFNVLEEVRAPAFPVIIPKMVAISAWNLTPQELGQDFQVTFRMTRPGHEPADHRVNFRAGNLRHRIFLNVVGVPLDGPGTMQFEVLMNDHHGATHTVTVAQEHVPPTPGPQ